MTVPLIHAAMGPVVSTRVATCTKSASCGCKQQWRRLKQRAWEQELNELEQRSKDVPNKPFFPTRPEAKNFRNAREGVGGTIMAIVADQDVADDSNDDDADADADHDDLMTHRWSDDLTIGSFDDDDDRDDDDGEKRILRAGGSVLDLFLLWLRPWLIF